MVLAGRPLGALLFGIDPIMPFGADVASFIYSGAALFMLKSRWPADVKAKVSPEPAPGSNRLSDDIWNGLSRVRQDRFACVVIVAFSAGTLIFQSLIMVVLAEAHVQKLSPLTIGMVLAASGVGGALGSAAASRLLGRLRYPWIILQSLIWFAGFAVLALLAGRQVILMAAVMAVLGFTGAMGNIELDTHLMRNFDKDMLARVTSVSRLMVLIACAVGPALGGTLVQEFGINAAMACLFLCTSALPLLAFMAPAAADGAARGAARAERREVAVPDAPVPVGQSL